MQRDMLLERVNAVRSDHVAAMHAVHNEHASEIAGFAEELRGFADRENFLAEDRGLFLSYVDRLRERAGELEAAAETQKDAKVKRACAQLTLTCNGCYYAFREQIQTHR